MSVFSSIAASGAASNNTPNPANTVNPVAATPDASVAASASAAQYSIGIDLGTTHSLVAAVRNGVAECLPDAQGRVLLPSVVRYLANGGRQIGYDAVAAQAQDARNTIASAKRFMGRSMGDLAHEAPHLPYEFVATPGMVALAPWKSAPKFWPACASVPKTAWAD